MASARTWRTLVAAVVVVVADSGWKSGRNGCWYCCGVVVPAVVMFFVGIFIF